MKSILLVCLGALVLSVIGCNSATSAASGTNNSNGSTTYTYANASPAITVLGEGIAEGAQSTSQSSTAYYTENAPGTGTTVYHLANYTPVSPLATSPYVLTGTLTEVSGTPSKLNGTVNFTGGSVTQVQYNNVTSSPAGGTYTITFGGLVTYTFNLATDSFTIN